MSHQYRLPAFLFVAAILTLTAESAAQTPLPKQDGPVQGYQGGYDPIDKSRAPAAPQGGKMDAGNADEGRSGKHVSGTVAQIDGRKVMLESGLVLLVPPTLEVDERLLRPGARIKALYEQQAGVNVVTGIGRE
jgi:hypothetical protein